LAELALAPGVAFATLMRCDRRTGVMSFLVYLFVLLVAACSVVFGLDWMQAPLQAPAQAERPAQAQTAKAEPEKSAVRTDTASAKQPGAETIGTASQSVDRVAAQQDTKTAAAPLCDVSACEQAYHTFNAADCTYKPYDGPRRLCTRGNPPRRQSAKLAVATDAHAQAGCNVSACSTAYQSFDAATCTYRPYDGTRRLCTK
jgi:cytoskeletal protein RodZ